MTYRARHYMPILQLPFRHSCSKYEQLCINTVAENIEMIKIEIVYHIID